MNTSTLGGSGKRKERHDRHREIGDAAAEIALQQGLARVTARRVAEYVGVQPGLVTHYFPTIDRLIAVAFTTLIERERVKVRALMEWKSTEVERFRRILDYYLSTPRDPMELLWLDAWRQAADRPQLRAAVIREMKLDVREMAELIEIGVRVGEFRVDDPDRAAIRILALLDARAVAAAVRHAAPDSPLDYGAVDDLVLGTAERELGITSGLLRR